ncbi:hypothetical protein SCOR_32345 [Sulfidibacter corallicola]
MKPSTNDRSGDLPYLVRRSLSEGLDLSEIPDAWVDAVVTGQGSRTGLRQAMKAWNHSRPLALIRFDADRIGGYVFESYSPPILCGASELLKGLNEHIQNHPHFGRYVVFSSGGEGLLLVPNPLGSTLPETICSQIEKLFAETTASALSVTTTFLEVSPLDFVGEPATLRSEGDYRLVSGTQALMARLQDQLRSLKNRSGMNAPPVMGKVARCKSCGLRAGEVEVTEKYEGSLCGPCHRRYVVGARSIRGVSVNDLLDPEDSLGGKPQYIGFIYADGNAMGRFFGKLECLREIRDAALAVAELFEKVDQRVKSYFAHQKGEERAGNSLPLSLLGGGDEKIWMLPAEMAVDVCCQIPAWLTDHTSSTLRGLLRRNGIEGLSVGIGLVLCNSKYPVRYQYDLARSLQASAKRRYYAQPDACISALDFEVVTNDGFFGHDFDATRNMATRTADPHFFGTNRPYTLDEFGQCIDMVRHGLSKLSKSQLVGLQKGTADGKDVFLNYACYQIARNRSSYSALFEARGFDREGFADLESFLVSRQPHLGENAWGTWVGDVVQLLPFLTNEATRKGVNHGPARH